MLVTLLDVVAVGLMVLGSAVTTISVYGVLRMPDVYSQLHAAGLASGVGALAILLASIATRDAATITDAVLIAAFLLLTAPVSGHAIAWAAYRRRTNGPKRPADAGRPTASS